MQVKGRYTRIYPFYTTHLLQISFLMRFFLCFIFLLAQLHSIGQGYLKVNGQYVENKNGAILLKGIGLGGWMLQEPYMLQLGNIVKAQYDLKNKITELVGKKTMEKFYDTWLSNQCTKADIDSIASWGFNSIRLPLHYNLFTLPIEKESVPGKNTWLKKGFQLTDSILSWCKANHLYLILDLHAAPGGQGNDAPIADRDFSKPSLWDDAKNKQKTIALWKKIATRYANEEWIGGYDILNEPNWGFEDAKDLHGINEKLNTPLKKLLIDISSAIRQVDKNHIIIIEGNGWGNNYNGIFPLWDNNMIISFHKYWNFNDNASIQTFLDYRQQYNVPIWLGETGENSNAWFTSMVQLCEKNLIGWCMWPLKKSGINNPMQVKINKGFEQIINYWSGKGKKPSKGQATEGLLQFAKNTKAENNIIQRDVVDAIIRQGKSETALPFSKNIITSHSIVYAVNYDLGRSSIAYSDKDSADYWVSTSTKTTWNAGGQYRNDGVDIKTCTDSITNGYNVAWINPGEWLQYTLYFENECRYDINFRYATNEKQGEIQLMINNKLYSNKYILPITKNKNSWKTTAITDLQFNKGWNTLKVIANKGGYQFNYMQFIPVNN